MKEVQPPPPPAPPHPHRLTDSSSCRDDWDPPRGPGGLNAFPQIRVEPRLKAGNGRKGDLRWDGRVGWGGLGWVSGERRSARPHSAVGNNSRVLNQRGARHAGRRLTHLSRALLGSIAVNLTGTASCQFAPGFYFGGWEQTASPPPQGKYPKQLIRVK